jgi:hypothetical protein
MRVLKEYVCEFEFNNSLLLADTSASIGTGLHFLGQGLHNVGRSLPEVDICFSEQSRRREQSALPLLPCMNRLTCVFE